MIVGGLKMGFLRRNLRAVGDYFLGLDAIDHYREMRRLYRRWCNPNCLRQFNAEALKELVTELTLKIGNNVATGAGVGLFAITENPRYLLVTGGSELVRIGASLFFGWARGKDAKRMREEFVKSSLNQQRNFLAEFEREIPRVEERQPRGDGER